jgi:hypothetical protein
MSNALQVPKRRRLRFDNHQQILDETRALAARPTHQLGNWSLEQICQHLADAMELCIDGGVSFSAPLRMRILARLARRRILKTGLPTGFKLPAPAEAVLYRPPQNIDAALAALERGIARLKSTSKRVPHPVLGKMTPAEWDLFHLRHGELHLSFIVPQDA